MNFAKKAAAGLGEARRPLHAQAARAAGDDVDARRDVRVDDGAASGSAGASLGSCAKEISGPTPIKIRVSSGNPCLAARRRVWAKIPLRRVI